MSGAQGAQPPGSRTATTYESVPQDHNPRTDLHSKEDERGIQIDKLQDKVEDAAGRGGPVFGAAATGIDDNNQQQQQQQQKKKKPDLGVTGTG